MNKGTRAIVKEERRLEQEKKRRIELANKMLIPVGGKTQESLGLISFDPSGVFRFEKERWMKVFEVSSMDESLFDVTDEISGRIRITFYLSESGRETCHLSLMESGEIYEEVRQKMEQDEEVLKRVCVLHALSVDDVMNQVAKNFCQDIHFSYASYVRGKKDWKKELFFEANEDVSDFRMGRLFGESLNVVTFSEETTKGIFTELKSLSCPMYVVMEINSLTKEEKLNFKRELEKKYNRRLPVNDTEDYINLSLSIVMLCDSKDAKDIVEKTILSVFLNYGMVMAPSFHNQKRVCESALSLGLIEEKAIQNVDKEVAKKLLGGRCDGDAKIEIRSD